ncbi:MAG: DUF3267 domain-containing protein [Ruminococcus sp.]|nr:DUF3267 domain-containing protein [Candidatus Apopatosoma intestinale]
MKATTSLPESYRKVCDIDLAKNKKTFLKVNGISFLIAAVLIVLGVLLGEPISAFHDTENGIKAYLIRVGALVGGLIAYIFLHELVHGIFMRAYSGVRPHYGFKLAYAYAGSDAYFARAPYLIITLAPVVIWGVVLGILSAVASPAWFWVFWFLEIMNLSGAAGGLYVTVFMMKMPSDILVRDTGTAMSVYSAEAAEKGTNV